MKFISLVVMTCVLSVIASCDPANDHEADSSQWMTDHQAAFARAEETGKPVLINFTGSDWCRYCIKLDEEVFSQQAFEDWADENVVLLEVDFPKNKSLPEAQEETNEQLAKHFHISGFPTIIFADADRNELGRYGYDQDQNGPEQWTAQAEEIIAQGRSQQ